MPEEDRRKGDLLILEKLSNIQTNLALNTQETKRLAEYQKMTNGKVASHEVRLQSIEGASAITSTKLAEIVADKQKAEEREEKKKERILTFKDKAMWVIIGGVLVLLQRIFAYLIQSDVLKKIIK